MAQKAGYWVDLFSAKLDEGSNTSWIQAMPLGDYDHPVYGTISITTDRVKRFAANVKSKVRGQDLDIDYDHKEYSGEAAGWVRDADARTDGLWLLVEWTDKAFSLIKQKAYRYFSPEFDDEWTNPKTKQEFKDVLFGGGITNRPFLKDILPINMSEVFAHAGDYKQFQDGGKAMSDTIKQIAALLGLGEDANEDQVLGALQVKLGAAGNTDPNDPANPGSGAGGDGSGGEGGSDNPADKGGEGAGGEQGQPAPMAASELTDAVKKLSESNPVVKQLMDIMDAQGAQLAANTKELKDAKIEGTLVKLSEKAKAKGYALPPTTKQALKEVFDQAPTQKLSDAVYQAFDKFLETGLAQLGEKGGSRIETGEKSAAVKMSEAVTKMRGEDKDLSYADAVVRVAADQPELFAEYQAESYAGRE